MVENYMENNNVIIGGKIVEGIEFSHEIYDEKFYKFSILTKRLSEHEDVLPVIISERIIDLEEIQVGKIVKIVGQFRSYNMQTETRNKLVLSVFVKEIEFAEEDVLTLNDANFVGYICKAPIYRKTPLGREIADVLIAVNRTYKKSDYIPCILWGRNAKFCENIEVGTLVKVNGRIQSRAYEKKLENGEVIKKVAYEVSVSKFAKSEEI
ncbi:MAG: single-stranded DNA-binding protein [Clostridia bacterium]|nr:single-stranded DNA-binding protein [Clostridia bacterium]